MRRRQFIAGVGGTAIAWPFGAHAQQAERMRRIGFLNGYAERDAESTALFARFMQGLGDAGWSEGRNLQVDMRWTGSNVALMPGLTQELVALKPDLIVTNSTPLTAMLQRATKTIPIVCITFSDPVGNGFAASLAHPGGNITGFISQEASAAAKMLEMLTTVAPAVKRAAIMFNPDTAGGGLSYYQSAFEEAGHALGVATTTAPIHDDTEIEAAMRAMAGEPRGGFVFLPDAFLTNHRTTIGEQAARYAVPAIYPNSIFCRSGGLLSLGPDRFDLYARAATYVNRILRGTPPDSLPIEVPIKYEIVLNAGAARALGLTIPHALLLQADTVIE